MKLKILLTLLLLIGPAAFAQTSPLINKTGKTTGRIPPAGIPVISDADITRELGKKADATAALLTAPTMQGEDGSVTVRVSVNSPISLNRTWLGQPTFPVYGLTRIPEGHLSIQGNTRGGATGASVLQAIANGPNGQNTCEGAMNCYIDPHARGYAGQDGVATTFFAYSRGPIAARQTITSISKATLANGSSITQLHLATPLPGASIVVPLMKIETTPGPGLFDYVSAYYGYTIPPSQLSNGQQVLPISADGLTLTLDGFANVSGVDMLTPPAGTTIDVDVLHQVDATYAGVFVKDGDGIRDAHVLEGIPLNNRSDTTKWSDYDPLGDSVDINGVFMPIDRDNGTGVGTGSNAFIASAGGAGTWKRGFSCRNQPNQHTDATYCLYNMWATVGFQSVADTMNGPTIGFAYVVRPHDLNTVTAFLTQAGLAKFSGLEVDGSTTMNGAFNVNGNTILNGNTIANDFNGKFQKFLVDGLNGQLDCQAGNQVYASDARNVAIDGTTGTPSGIMAFCNNNHRWLSLAGNPLTH